TTLDRFAVFAAGFAQVHLDIDQTWRNDTALGIEHRRARAGRQSGADFDDIAIDDADIGRARTSTVDDLSAPHQDLRQSSPPSPTTPTAPPCAPRHRSQLVR